MSLRETIINTGKWFIVAFALTVGGAGAAQAINANPTKYGLLADSIDLIGDGIQMANELLAFIAPLI